MIPICRRADNVSSPSELTVSTSNDNPLIASFVREAHLRVHDRTVCVATGTIELYSESCLEAIESKRIGLGQLFRYLGDP